VRERRFYLRVPLHTQVVIIGRTRFRAEATGLSGGGMAVRAEGLHPNEKVAIAMNLPGASSSPLVVDARVAHVGDGIAGLAFSEIPQEDAQVIEQFIWNTLSPPAKEATPEPAPQTGALAVRVPLDFSVTVVRSNERVEARATGLSSSGLAVVSPNLEQGEHVEVQFQLPGAGQSVSLPGVVEHARRGVAGIRFVGLTREELGDLEGRLWQYLKGAVGTNGAEPEQAEAGADETPRVLEVMDKAAGRAAAQAQRSCEIPGCRRAHKARGLCALHYNRLRRRSH